MSGGRKGTNKTFTTITSDIVAIGTPITLEGIDASRPHCHAGVQFFADADGVAAAIPTLGSIVIELQTLASKPLFEMATGSPIIVSNQETISWTANTITVRATPSDLDVATHYRLVIVCNETGNAAAVETARGAPRGDAVGLVTRPIFPHSAFGELQVENSIPIVQMIAVYGITDKQETFTSLGGTVAAAGGLFQVTSGTNANGFSTLASRRQAKYRAGQGLMARFTALFDTPQVDSDQLAGLINNTDRLGFGFIDTDFGIIYDHGGESEIQELTITTPSAGSEDATITIDDVAFTVPLTVGTVEHNAFEIANSLNTQVSLWDFSSNGDEVVARALVARVYTGAFTFASGTAAGAFAQVNAGVAPIETFIKQVDWNVHTRSDLDPSKGNVYQIQFQYLGFGDFFFHIESPVTGLFELVHIIEYSNLNVVPNLGSPTFRVGWSARNTGNTTSLTLKGGSGSLFNEGAVVVTETPRTTSNTQSTVTTAAFTNIITFRNRLVYKVQRNRVETEPFIITVLTDSTKGALIEITKNAIPAGDLDFSYLDKATSVSEIATDAVVMTGGTPVLSFIASTLGVKLNLAELGLFLFPGESFSISGKIISGASASVTVTITSVEDQ